MDISNGSWQSRRRDRFTAFAGSSGSARPHGRINLSLRRVVSPVYFVTVYNLFLPLWRENQTEGLGNPLAQLLINLIPELERALLNVTLDSLAHVSGHVAHQMRFVPLRQHLPVEGARLHEIVVLGMRRDGTAHDLSTYPPGRLGCALRIGQWPAIAVGRIPRLIALMMIAHRPIFVVAMHLDHRSIDRYLQVVGADTIAMRVRIAEQATQQHLIRAGADARHHVRRFKGRLLDLRKEVLRVAIQHQASYGDRRVVRLWPDLGEIKRIEAILSRLSKGHDLHLQSPDGIVLPGNRLAQVAAVIVRVLCRHRSGFTVGKVLDTLLGLEVVLDPVFLSGLVVPQERMAAIAVHMAIGTRRAPVSHQERDLMDGLRRQ